MTNTSSQSHTYTTTWDYITWYSQGICQYQIYDMMTCIEANKLLSLKSPWTWRCAIFADRLSDQLPSMLAQSQLTLSLPVGNKNTEGKLEWLQRNALIYTSDSDQRKSKCKWSTRSSCTCFHLLLSVWTEQSKVAVRPVILLCLHKTCHFSTVKFNSRGKLSTTCVQELVYLQSSDGTEVIPNRRPLAFIAHEGQGGLDKV